MLSLSLNITLSSPMEIVRSLTLPTCPSMVMALKDEVLLKRNKPIKAGLEISRFNG